VNLIPSDKKLLASDYVYITTMLYIKHCNGVIELGDKISVWKLNTSDYVSLSEKINKI